MLKIELLEKLLSIPSPTGYTQKKVAFLEEYCHSLGYETYKNQKGRNFK